MQQIYRDCFIECFRENGILPCNIFTHNGYEINTFSTEDATNVREYMKYLKKMVDEWYDNGRKDEQKR